MDFITYFAEVEVGSFSEKINQTCFHYFYSSKIKKEKPEMKNGENFYILN